MPRYVFGRGGRFLYMLPSTRYESLLAFEIAAAMKQRPAAMAKPNAMIAESIRSSLATIRRANMTAVMARAKATRAESVLVGARVLTPRGSAEQLRALPGQLEQPCGVHDLDPSHRGPPEQRQPTSLAVAQLALPALHAPALRSRIDPLTRSRTE